MSKPHLHSVTSTQDTIIKMVKLKWTVKILIILIFINRYKEKKQRCVQVFKEAFSVYSLPPPRQDKMREMWREAQNKYRKKEVNAIMNLTPPSLEASLNEDNAVAPTNNSIRLIRSEMFSSFGFSASLMFKDPMWIRYYPLLSHG